MFTTIKHVLCSKHAMTKLMRTSIVVPKNGVFDF